MKLTEYLIEAKTTASDFAKRVGVTEATVSRWCSGDRVPDIQTAAKIQDATANLVRIDEWVVRQ